MDQLENIQAMPFIGHYDINQVEIFTSTVTKLVLVIGHNHINQANVFTLVYH